MCIYADIETGEKLTKEQLKKEYDMLKESGDTEADTFECYLANCLAGTLERSR